MGAGQGLIVTTFNYLGHKISFKGIKFVDENNKVIAKYATKNIMQL